MRQTHPEMVRRFEALQRDAARRNWRIGVTSSTRSRAQQEDLYRRWRAGTYDVPSVANPNGNNGTSPWGWTIRGSYHMPQADGYSHALDLWWDGCSAVELERLAATYGLVQTVPRENWHYQWFHRRVIFDAPALVAAAAALKGRKMFLWTCAQNDGQHVNYLYADRQVTSLHSLDTAAWGLATTGVPHAGHLNEHDHTVLMKRLLDQPDPHTGADGSWRQ